MSVRGGSVRRAGELMSVCGLQKGWREPGLRMSVCGLQKGWREDEDFRRAGERKGARESRRHNDEALVPPGPFFPSEEDAETSSHELVTLRLVVPPGSRAGGAI
jgi:hypothetical protein